VPTDVELQAAYCLKVIQLFTIPFAEQARSNMMSAGALDELDASAKARIDAAMKDEIKKGRDRELQLSLYLVPRMSDLDPAPILAAMQQRELDAASFKQSLAKCYAQCPLAAPSDSMSRAASRCGKDCADHDELAPRVASCSTLNWLHE